MATAPLAAGSVRRWRAARRRRAASATGAQLRRDADAEARAAARASRRAGARTRSGRRACARGSGGRRWRRGAASARPRAPRGQVTARNTWLRCGVGSSSSEAIGFCRSMMPSSSLRAASLREKNRFWASTCLWFHSAGCSTEASMNSGEPSLPMSAPPARGPSASSFCFTSSRSRLKTFDFHLWGA